MRQVQLGPCQQGLCILHRCLRGRGLGGQYAGLLAGGFQGSLVLCQLGTSGQRAVFRLLGVLQRTCTLPRQVLIALQFMAGKFHLGHIRIHRGLGLFDQRALAFQHRQGIDPLRLRRRHTGLRGLHRCAVVLRVDPGQQLPGLDRLVILHQHLVDKPRHFGRNQGEIGADKSIISALHGTRDKDQPPQRVQHDNCQRDGCGQDPGLAPACCTHFTTPTGVPGA